MAVFYFFVSFVPEFRSYEDQPDYAPTVTSSVLASAYALIYAAASSLAAWESGRLRRDGVWTLAPARHRLRVAADVLLPVILLAWLVTTVVVAMALIRQGIAPSLPSLVLPALAMTVSLAHAVIGFVVGLVAPRLIAAPLLAVGVFYAVAASWSYEPFWLRHVSGQFPVDLMYGELPTLRALVPHILFAGSIATGLVVLCALRSGTRQRIVLTALGCAIAVAGTVTAQRMTADWDFNPPLSTGHVPVRCVGTAPAVCAPEAMAGDLDVIQGEVRAALAQLNAAGVSTSDLTSVNDSSASGRHAPASTTQAWWFSLVNSHRSGTTPLAIVTHAVRFPCDEPDPVISRSAMLWAAVTADAEDFYLDWQQDEMRQYIDGESWLAEARDRVAEARRLPLPEQTEWFHAEMRRACAPTAEEDR
ncbi:hypothetical protein E1265_12215 [Streptomyces sp. 8K308]|uniref:hypothetical protein n=1 Tax=Streptomyces sp. 8K308 TaxID=2530388 RepID=UPI0010F1E9FD|nr:hypothetical protein [Streptomyces sp. 8K308]TDC23618.1 hypothetical protein E1265_12215 [Streptomyces sp. 8K308]